MGIYSVVMGEISWYTGLSPAAFFTIAGLMVFVFQTVSSMFVSPEDFNKPPVATISMNDKNNSSFLNGVLGQTTTTSNHQQPLQLGDMTEQQLRAYNGSDPNKPLLISIKGQIYDVSSSRYSGLFILFVSLKIFGEFETYPDRFKVMICGIFGLISVLMQI